MGQQSLGTQSGQGSDSSLAWKKTALINAWLPFLPVPLLCTQLLRKTLLKEKSWKLIKIHAKTETSAEVQNTVQNCQITNAACSLQTWIVPQQELQGSCCSKPTQPLFPSLLSKSLNFNPKMLRFHKTKLFVLLKSVLLSS